MERVCFLENINVLCEGSVLFFLFYFFYSGHTQVQFCLLLFAPRCPKSLTSVFQTPSFPFPCSYITYTTKLPLTPTTLCFITLFSLYLPLYQSAARLSLYSCSHCSPASSLIVFTFSLACTCFSAYIALLMNLPELSKEALPSISLSFSFAFGFICQSQNISVTKGKTRHQLISK